MLQQWQIRFDNNLNPFHTNIILTWFIVLYVQIYKCKSWRILPYSSDSNPQYVILFAAKLLTH